MSRLILYENLVATEKNVTTEKRLAKKFPRQQEHATFSEFSFYVFLSVGLAMGDILQI